MINKLQRLINSLFPKKKEHKNTQQLLECYCKDQPWAASCRIYED